MMLYHGSPLQKISSKENSPKVVRIPEGNISPSLSSIDAQEIPKPDCPDIYKKGVSHPSHTTKLPPVIDNLEGANQISNKNPINDAMENEVNDTPVYVETESEIVKAGKEISQRGNSPIVVKIPEGSTSPSISSINMKETSSTDSPDLYKKKL